MPIETKVAPVCARCGQDTFGMRRIRPEGAAHPVNVVLCVSCGAVQGVVPLEEATTMIARLSERVRRLGFALGVDLDMGK